MGSYEVIFPRDVSNCAFTATVGEPDLVTVAGQISAARRLNNPNGVHVVTFTSTGAAADIAFHRAVHC
jgi:hypothetical protein